MRIVSAILITILLTSPVQASWAKFKERFSNENIGKALGDKNCWERAFSFQKAKRTTCKK